MRPPRPSLILAALLAAGLGLSKAGAEDLGAGTGGGLGQFWQDEKISLALRTDYFENSKDFDGETNLWGQTAQLKAFPLVSGDLDGKIDARLTEPNSPNGDAAVFQLVEGYATFHLGSLDIRVGKQIVGWGRADGINPTDNVTPHNLTVQLPFDEDNRFGTNALKADLYLDPELDLTLFTTPFFEPSVFPLPSGAGLSLRNLTPAATLANSELGVRLNKTGGDFDWSLSYFRGYRPLPDLTVDPSQPSGGLVDMRYTQMDVVGGDFARNLGPFGVRGEAAYAHPTGPDAENSNQADPYFQWVLGVDRAFDQELSVNLQLIGRLVQDFNTGNPGANPFLQEVDLLNAIVNTEQDPETYEISFRVSDNWMNETLGAEVFGVVDLTRHDGYLRPSVNYAFTDQLKGWVGWDIYWGDSDTQYGFLQPTQGLFSELRYTF